jgi:hypothetical protein
VRLAFAPNCRQRAARSNNNPRINYRLAMAAWTTLCRRANGALRFVLTIDYGPSLPPTEIITRVLIDPILTRWGASERLPRAENQCAVRLQLVSGLVRIAHRKRAKGPC